MNDPRPNAPRKRHRRTARVSNSRWTEPVLVTIAFVLAAVCYALVKRFDVASWHHGQAAILYVIVPPGLFLILTYDRLSSVLDRWLSRRRDTSTDERR